MQKFNRAIETIIRMIRSSRGALDERTESIVLRDPVPTPHLNRKPGSPRGVLGTSALNPLEYFFHEHFSNEDNSIKNAADRLRPAFAAKRARALEQARRPRSPRHVPNCMTVNVEDYCHLSPFAERISRKNWNRNQSRIEQSTNRLLRVFDESNVTGTFFVLGWIADRYPELIQRIADAGHEVASHGYWHQKVDNLTPAEFGKDIVASRDAIFNACGVVVTAYRAPEFSILNQSRWALEVLSELGFRMDSSMFPVSSHYQDARTDFPRRMGHVDTGSGQIIEVPPSVGRANGFPLPLGGKYFRLYPLWMTRKAIREFRSRVGPAMFYIHPWELDPDLPRINSSLKRKKRMRSLYGVKRCEEKLRNLFKTDRFDTMTNVVRAVMPEYDYIPGVGCKAISDHSSSAIYIEPSATQTLSISNASAVSPA